MNYATAKTLHSSAVTLQLIKLLIFNIQLNLIFVNHATAEPLHISAETIFAFCQLNCELNNPHFKLTSHLIELIGYIYKMKFSKSPVFEPVRQRQVNGKDFLVNKKRSSGDQQSEDGLRLSQLNRPFF